MNVTDSWVKEVCEKLGISEPQPEIGVFWDDDCELEELALGRLTASGTDSDYPYERNNGSWYNHFKLLSPEIIAMIKKDLEIE